CRFGLSSVGLPLAKQGLILSTVELFLSAVGLSKPKKGLLL
ncbi:uncharacterized, partial [Tachysurus ichikawai]